MFVSPKNNRSPNRPKRDDLIKILQAFIDSRAVMPSDIRIEGEETDEEQDEPVALPDQDTENLIDMINMVRFPALDYNSSLKLELDGKSHFCRFANKAHSLF